MSYTNIIRYRVHLLNQEKKHYHEAYLLLAITQTSLTQAKTTIIAKEKKTQP